MSRESIANLLSLGRVPSSEASEAEIDAFARQLDAIETPITKDEAERLIRLLPPDDDDCYGLAWQLLHKIETAHALFDSTFMTKLSSAGPWEDRLLRRVQNHRSTQQVDL